MSDLSTGRICCSGAVVFLTQRGREFCMLERTQFAGKWEQRL